MSHSNGTVKFEDGTIRYVEYNGTDDIMYPLSYKTENEMDENWRKIPEEPNCKHNNREPVELYAAYGGGISWQGECCKYCGWITQGRNPYFSEDEYMDHLYFGSF